MKLKPPPNTLDILDFIDKWRWPNNVECVRTDGIIDGGAH